MNWHLHSFLAVVVAGCFSFPCAGLGSHDVLVVANAQVDGSRRVAEAYSNSRGVPKRNLLLLDIPSTSAVNRASYCSRIEAPVLAAVEKTKTKCVVLCHGVPWQVKDGWPHPGVSPVSSSWASVDSELAAKGKSGARGIRAVRNPYFGSREQFNRNDMLLVARLDGASVDDSLALISRARVGLQRKGRAIIDLQEVVNGQSNGFVRLYNSCLAASADWLSRQRIETVLDTRQKMISPGGRPVQFYWGWYAGPHGDCASNSYVAFDWQPGAVAVHVCSLGAAKMRRVKSSVPALVHAGATATIGTVHEPLVEGWTRPDLFFRNYVRRDGTCLTFIESAYAATPYLSWQNVFVGDPLLRFRGGRIENASKSE